MSLNHQRWRKAKCAVIYTPWQGEPRIVSTHASMAAAGRAAASNYKEFHRCNPNGYGVEWIAAVVRPNEDLAVVADYAVRHGNA